MKAMTKRIRIEWSLPFSVSRSLMDGSSSSSILNFLLGSESAFTLSVSVRFCAACFLSSESLQLAQSALPFRELRSHL